MTAVFSGGTPNTSNPLFWGGTIPWMNSGELNLKIVRQVQGRITKAGMDSSSTHFVPAECVLIGLAGQVAMRFQVSSIPMLVVFKDGKAVAKSVGYRSKPEIAAIVEGAR